MDLSIGFVTWICLNLNWLLAVTGVMHEADDVYSIRSTWSCYWLDQFLTLALNILILSIFYISMDLSTNYFAHFRGCWASFVCSCHSILESCVTFSGVKLSIKSFVLFGKHPRQLNLPECHSKISFLKGMSNWKCFIFFNTSHLSFKHSPFTLFVSELFV